ncbi:MAG TPA: tetratricopeptide repeat protein [Myxococcota bacterium]|nr:tetratricopeptide repeat protein [Myxococcota bacterium]
MATAGPSLALAAAVLLAAHAAAARDLRDLYFGEALYYAYQERYFDALERLDTEIAQHYGVDEPKLDSLQFHIGRAEFSVGDFELDYRMHQRAGRAIRAVLEANVEDPVRNEAAFRLARILFQKEQPRDALQALARIHGEIPEAIRDDLEFLRANVYLALGQPGDAVPVLQGLQGSKSLQGFAQYNLGIALLQQGKTAEAVAQLGRAGEVSGDDAPLLAIRDKSNLVLGTLFFEDSAFGSAQSTLDRVRLQGPFSNQALLRAGWADASAQRFERALVPWSLLAERDPTDAAVQEALLALPYAYSKQGVHGRAALLYGRAVEAYAHELEKIDASLRSIREGEFLKDLVREEIRQDKDWVIRLRSLEGAPETFYLASLMASHDFQTALQNYLDLEDLRKRLVSWQRSLEAFEELVSLRRHYYEPLLPQVDAEFRKLDAQMRLRLEQREHLDRRLQHLLVDPRPELLATSDEQQASARIGALESALEGRSDEEAAALRARTGRLKGLLRWDLETHYHERLTQAHRHLAELNQQIDALNQRYQSFVRTRQAATHSYVGYEEPIRRLRAHVVAAQERLGVLMEAQGRVLESVANEELKLRRERLEAYQNQARFAFADSYDRAAKAQAQAQ